MNVFRQWYQLPKTPFKNTQIQMFAVCKLSSIYYYWLCDRPKHQYHEDHVLYTCNGHVDMHTNSHTLYVIFLIILLYSTVYKKCVPLWHMTHVICSVPFNSLKSYTNDKTKKTIIVQCLLWRQNIYP